MININNEINLNQIAQFIDTVNELNDCCLQLQKKLDGLNKNVDSVSIRLLSKEDVKHITGWSTKRVSEVFECPELKDKVVYLGKKMQIEESIFKAYLQSGPKRDNNTYWLNKLN